MERVLGMGSSQLIWLAIWQAKWRKSLTARLEVSQVRHQPKRMEQAVLDLYLAQTVLDTHSHRPQHCSEFFPAVLWHAKDCVRHKYCEIVC